MKPVILLCALLMPLTAFAKMAFPVQYFCLSSKTTHVSMRLQIADTQERMRHGLMFRKTLKPYDGMAFFFGKNHRPKMWMKNTFIPLDMLFIDKKGKVVQIARDTTPQSEAIITTDTDVTTVIELEAGRAAREHITKDTMLLPGRCPNPAAKH